MASLGLCPRPRGLSIIESCTLSKVGLEELK